jgi:hypothetical protein
MSTIDLTKLGAAVAQIEDQTKAVKGGGGEYKPPAAGATGLRFCAYIELGVHDDSFQGKPRQREQVALGFELSGPKHPPVEHEGKKYPAVMFIKLAKSMNDKAGFFKLFQRMNYAGKASHMMHLLGESYRGTVVHRTFKGKDGTDRVFADLKGTEGYTIQPPRYDDPETGETKVLPVDPLITPIQVFLWQIADMDQWASIFIDGEYPEEKNEDGTVKRAAKSKNRWQAEIMKALNFPGSPIEELLRSKGAKLDIPDVGEDPEASPNGQEDPLAGVA